MTQFIPQPFAQQLLKNKLETEKLRAKVAYKETENKVNVSSLRGIKGIGDKTISTLIENGINSLEDFTKYSEEELYKFLTPVQFHQISRYIKENTSIA